MSSATLGHIQPRSDRPPMVLPNAVLAMSIFVATEIMFFAAFISAFVIVKAGYTRWPPLGQPRLPVAATAFNSLSLLASGVILVFAARQFQKAEGRAAALRLLDISIFLGALFVLLQGYEWLGLIRFGMTITSSTYGGFFYLIVGTHALHAFAALLALAVAGWQLRRGRLTAEAFQATRIFWYFVVCVWPILYGLVYLS